MVAVVVVVVAEVQEVLVGISHASERKTDHFVLMDEL
jgi:hypothetical protein